MAQEKFCEILQGHLGNDVIVKVTKPPMYISNLKISGVQDEVILVYKKTTSKENTCLNQEVELSEMEKLEDSAADLSITGQPLECPFDKEDTENLSITIAADKFVPEEYYHTPLSMVEARKYLSIVNLKLKPPLPVWILADMSDRYKTFLLGSERDSSWRKRIWAIAHSNQTERKPIKDMIENFEKTFKITSEMKITSQVCCVFNIQDQPGMAKNAKCFLESNWKRPSYEVPVSQADTSLVLECSVGQEESQISRWWQQLNLLHDYLEIIKQRKDTQKVQVSYERDSIQLPSFKTGDAVTQSLSHRLLDLLQRSDSMSVCRQLASFQNVTSALNSTIHELLADKQKGQDFTDRLWSLLVEAETYQELAECFRLVIREVRKHSVKPYIFVKNKTRMASLLRSIKNTSSEIELMLEPLELMVEMGLEKLKRDYMFMFLASQIASEESLCMPKLPSFSEVVGSEWQTTVDLWLQWLARLHTVLELVSVIHTTMSPPILVQVTSIALSKFLATNSPVHSLLHLINNRTYQMQAPVISKEVKSFIEGSKTFFKWTLNLSAVTERYMATSTYILLEQSPLPQQILLRLVDDETLNNTDTFVESVLQESISSFSKLQEKYTYIQLCSVGEKYNV